MSSMHVGVMDESLKSELLRDLAEIRELIVEYIKKEEKNDECVNEKRK